MEKKEIPFHLSFRDSRKGKILAAAGVILGILLLIGGAFIPESKSTLPDSDTFYAPVSYTEALEIRVEELCKSIAGVTEATVLLTLENGKETIYAGNTASQSSEVSSGQTFDYIFMNRNGEETPVMITEIYPTIRGVAVVCTNGNDTSVQLTIIKLLSASLGISSNRIQVAGS